MARKGKKGPRMGRPSSGICAIPIGVVIERVQGPTHRPNKIYHPNWGAGSAWSGRNFAPGSDPNDFDTSRVDD